MKLLRGYWDWSGLGVRSRHRCVGAFFELAIGTMCMQYRVGLSLHDCGSESNRSKKGQSITCCPVADEVFTSTA